MWPEQDGVSEPDWVRTEREQFKSFRDKNGDGRMDSSEVREWVMPDDYDHTVAESKHLIFESDMDRVGTVRTLGPAYNEFGYNEQIFSVPKSLTAVLKSSVQNSTRLWCNHAVCVRYRYWDWGWNENNGWQ